MIKFVRNSKINDAKDDGILVITNRLISANRRNFCTQYFQPDGSPRSPTKGDQI